MTEAAAKVRVFEPHPTVEASSPPHSDDALALEFSRRHSTELRYVASQGWFHWDGKRWEKERTLLAYDLARLVCRDAANACETNRPHDKAALASGTTVSAVEKLARAARQHAATDGQWDRDPWLLNTPDGTIDLHTGEIGPHRPENYITKITAVGPSGKCPLWLSVLELATGGNKPLQGYLQRLFGYALTGLTSEQALFFFYGMGANGKSLILSTVARVMGSYAQTSPMEVFTTTNFPRHETELADLKGARLVTATETDAGKRWNEPRIKALTGGEMIKARYMRQDYFEFQPELKLVVAGNHKPELNSVDEAIRRRINIIPFNITVPKEARDPNLFEKLKSEWPGILRWMIEGCVQWQLVGLNAPDAVKAATAEYLDAEDTIARFIRECCVVNGTASVQSSTAFREWKRYAESIGEPPGSNKAFTHRMEAHGFAPFRTRNGARLGGLTLKSGPPSNDEN